MLDVNRIKDKNEYFHNSVVQLLTDKANNSTAMCNSTIFKRWNEVGGKGKSTAEFIMTYNATYETWSNL